MGDDIVQSGKHQASFKRPFLLLLFVGSIAMAVINLNAIAAELFSLSGRHLLSIKNDVSWRSRDEIYAHALDRIAQSKKLQPVNPEYHTIEARLLIDRCKYWDWVEQWDQKRKCFQQARDSLRIALATNSESAATWSNLLLAKFYLSELDEEFNHALDRATVIGRHDYSTNKVIAWMGLTEWSRWSDHRRSIFTRSILMMHLISPRDTKLLADAAGRGLLYCKLTNGDPRQHKSCRHLKSGTGNKNKKKLQAEHLRQDAFRQPYRSE